MGERTASNLDWRDLEQQVREVSPICGFAPGGYVCPCSECSRAFIGDKRSRQCFACAFKRAVATVENSVKIRDALENMLIAIGMGWDLDGVVAQANEALRPTEASPSEPSQ